MRKLASIRRVSSVEPIEGADRIELLHIDGWQCIAKKGELKAGDLCVYFEIDSRLPEEPWSEFMRPRNFKVKTVKMRGVLSQGLALPPSILPKDVYGEGNDVTERLKVTKILSKEEQREEKVYAERKGKRLKWFRTVPIVRHIVSFLFPRLSSEFPQFIRKTDETRVQNLKDLPRLLEGRSLYATEKLDGQSVTLFYHKDLKTGLFSKGLYGVCSRNVYYPSDVGNNWWDISRSYEVKERLTELCKVFNKSIALQGEIVGPGIQGNKYRLPKRKLYIFNVYDIDEQKYFKGVEKEAICSSLNLHMVPNLGTIDVQDVEGFLSAAEGDSLLFPVEREGIVVRDKRDESFSFKAISNKFLLEG